MDILIVIISSIFMLMLVSYIKGYKSGIKEHQNEAIKNGFGEIKINEYNQQYFKWKDQKCLENSSA